MKCPGRPLPPSGPGHLPHGRCGLKSYTSKQIGDRIVSPPAREVWIEIQLVQKSFHFGSSPPAREVWIEIFLPSICLKVNVNSHLPHGRCGLKFLYSGQPTFGEGHLPHGRCGLKYIRRAFYRPAWASPPAWEVRTEISPVVSVQPVTEVTSHMGGMD